MSSTDQNKPTAVGWQFVSQYYTFVNKHPERLHCFYTKNSAFIHGTEGEDGRPCYGQHEIHEKILSIGFQDCKVFIHSVDAQASAANGIVVQAIGEISNKNEAWRKFTQTFFLAEQPNGYFVLNDIFRYLKEDVDDEEAAEEEEEDEKSALVAHEEKIVAEPAPAVEASHVPNAHQQSRAEPPPALESQLKPLEAVPEAAAQLPNGVNGHAHDEHISSPSPEPVTEFHAEPEAEEPQEEEEEAVAETAEPATTAPAPPVTPPPETKPEPVAAPPTAPAAAAPATPALSAAPIAAAAAPPKPSTPAAPEKPKTWANLAASKPNAWGSNLASESKGVSAAAAPITPAPTPPRATNGHAAKPPPSQQPAGDVHPYYAAALAVTTTQCFVKAVVENVDSAQLKAVLEARFGPVKELDIVRAKACAFLEFERLDSAKKAIIASLRNDQGGEGGIRIGEKGTDPAAPVHNREAPRIIIETRKERGDRPPPRPRGGAPTGERGGYRGAPGGRGRGASRGTPIPAPAK